MSSATMEHRTKSVSIATSRPYLLQHSGLMAQGLELGAEGVSFRMLGVECSVKSVSIATSRPYLLQHSGFRVPDLRFEVSGLKFFLV